eukprot:scaffold129841_cov15-Tisochrysis_lutea.AAC.1
MGLGVSVTRGIIYLDNISASKRFDPTWLLLIRDDNPSSLDLAPAMNSSLGVEHCDNSAGVRGEVCSLRFGLDSSTQGGGTAAAEASGGTDSVSREMALNDGPCPASQLQTCQMPDARLNVPNAKCAGGYAIFQMRRWLVL